MTRSDPRRSSSASSSLPRRTAGPALRAAALGATLAALAATGGGCALLLAGAAGGAAGGGVAAAREEGYPPMVYVGTVLGNVIYFPAKVIFAGVGAGASGLAYVFSGGHSEVSRPVWTAAVEGSYVLTPAMIAGRERVRFVGP